MKPTKKAGIGDAVTWGAADSGGRGADPAGIERSPNPLPDDPEMLLLCECYQSLQGEGRHIGVPTVFVRTTVCNLRCAWCDSEFSFTEGDPIRLDALIQKIKSFPARHVCLTGGEPLLQKQIVTLCDRLLGLGYDIVVETGGSLPIGSLPEHPRLCVSLDIKCPSSAMASRMNRENIAELRPKDQLKFVIADRKDYDYAKDILNRFAVSCPVIFQPEGGTRLAPLADWVLVDGLNVTVLPQLHKLIWGDVRGV